MTIRHTLDNSPCWHGGDEDIACRTGKRTYNDDGKPVLTDREVQVVRLLADGKSNKEIAQALVLSTMTIKTHMRRITSKVGVEGRVSLAVWAVRNNIV